MCLVVTSLMIIAGVLESCLCCRGYRGCICHMSLLSWLQGIHLPHVYVVMVTGIHLPHVCVVMVTGDTFGSCHGYRELVKDCPCKRTSLISPLQAIEFASTVATLLGFSLPIPLCISDMMEAHWVVLLSYVSPILALITIVIYAVA